MTYELRDHTADVAVEATGSSLSATFAAVADGLTAASCESVPENVGDRFAVTVTAESREALLFDYLDRLIYERDVRAVLPADHECQVVPATGTDHAENADDGDDAAEGAEHRDDSTKEDDPEWTVDASARGIPLDEVVAREIKAVTYSEMTLERRDGGWYAYVVLDV